jgi:hypothetical protein
MITPNADKRSEERRINDDQISAEPQIPIPELAADTVPSPVEAHLSRLRRNQLAVEGVVENGLVRLLDPTVKLPEHSRVIVVASRKSVLDSRRNRRQYGAAIQEAGADDAID